MTAMQKLERGAAWLLLVNALLGLGVSLWGRSGELPVLALLGLLSGWLSLRGNRAGVWGAMAFYAPQVLSYYAYSMAWSFSVKSGLSLAFVARLPDGVLIVNVVALGLLAVTAAILVRRSGAGHALHR
jgi:hypothetical protein